MDTIEGYYILTSTFHLGRVELIPEEKEARNQEDLSTDNLGVLMKSGRNRMKVLLKYTNNEMKALDRHFSMVLEEVMETWAEQCQMRKPRVPAESVHFQDVHQGGLGCTDHQVEAGDGGDRHCLHCERIRGHIKNDTWKCYNRPVEIYQG